jgi:diguanylate cyclase (GGDEF)-like protein
MRPKAAPSLVAEARWYGFVAVLAATFAALSLAVPRPDPIRAIIVTLIIALTYAAGVLLWHRAPLMTRPLLWFLSIVSAAAASLSGTLAVDRGVGGDGGVALGHRGWVWLIAGMGLVAVVVRRLLSELRTRVHQLDVLARTDQLTGVANRRAWDEELPRELTRSQRDRAPVCVAVLDLDRFKAFNDMRGHQEGDALLMRTAVAWREAVRTSDFIARYGGEEFAVILRGCALEDALPIVERLRLVVPDEQTCSVGLGRWDGRETAEALVKRVDDALYEAKLAGRDRVKIAAGRNLPDFGPSHMPWPSIVRQLLETRSVVAAYQPVVRLADRTIVAYEALARPNADNVDIEVERLFSSAQRMGLGRDLDWLCRRAALAGATWLPAGTPLFINCGLSGLIDPVHRVDQMLLVLEAVGRSPADVVMEITERELVGDLNRLRQVVNSHRSEGFRFAIDDVGEGHSTLEVLAATEPEFIKVARRLVVEAANRGGRAAIRAVVAFASEIGADVIAEGIEHVETADYLRQLGVNYGQGYAFGRPAFPRFDGGSADDEARMRDAAAKELLTR